MYIITVLCVLFDGCGFFCINVYTYDNNNNNNTSMLVIRFVSSMGGVISPVFFGLYIDNL